MLPEKIYLKRERKQNEGSNRKKKQQQNMSYDLFICFEGQLIPACQSKLLQCQFIHEQLKKNSKIIYINQNLDPTMFMKVLNFFHDAAINLQSMRELEAFIDVVDFLGAISIINQIQTHIKQNIQQYDIFNLLQLAYKFGLKQVFDLCMQYLQLERFEQIRYNKFDFLECNFEVFQIVLRRHHILKMKGQIEGLQTTTVQQVIRTYCHRNKLNQQILNRLVFKYVKNLQKFNEFKKSLRLDQLAVCKNIFQSGNVESDFVDHHEGREVKQQIHQLMKPASKRDNPRPRKYSVQVNKQINFLSNNMRFSDSKLGCTQIQQPQGAQSIVKSSTSSYDYKIDIASNKQKKQIQPLSQQKPRVRDRNYLRIEQAPQSIISKISSMLNQYQQALNQHDQKYKKMRRNSRSMLFHKNLQSQHRQILNNAKLLNSINLANNNLFLTIYTPTKNLFS